MDIEKKATLSLIALGIAMISPAFIATPLSKALSSCSQKDNTTLNVTAGQKETIAEPKKITAQNLPLAQQPARVFEIE